jgi:hypothetical protein
MKHNFRAVLVHLDNRIAPTKIRVQMIHPKRHLDGYHSRIEPSPIFEHHRESPSFTFDQIDPIMLLRRSVVCRLDSAHGPLDCCRDKRLLNSLDHDTNQHLRPEEHQTCQDWNFDLHRFTVIFFSR